MKKKEQKPNKEEVKMITKAKRKSVRAHDLMVRRGIIRGKRGR